MKSIHERIPVQENKEIYTFKFQAADLERIIPMHFHKEIEILYCLKGKLRIVMNGQSSIVNEREICFIQGNVPHSTQSLNENNVIVAQFFDIDNLFQDVSIRFSLNPSKEQFLVYENLKKLIIELYEWGLSENPFSYLMSQSIKREIEYFLLTYFSEPLTDKQGENLDQQKRLSKVLNILNKSFTDNISLQEVADISGYSSSYLSRMFHKLVGQTFSEYKHSLCLEKALELIEKTELNLSEVAIESGFANEKSFRRVFQKTMKTTPKEYRNVKKRP